MKFSKDYSKLDKPIFTTIRKYPGYMVGQVLTINTPTKKFMAKVTHATWMNKALITEELAHSDADCSREELIAMLEKWYGKVFDDFVLLTLEKVEC